MAIKCLTVKVHRSEVMEPVTTIRAWELPILEAMHVTVEVIDEAPYAIKITSADDEYARLEKVYGRTTNEDGSRGLPYVAAVYGQFQLGRNRLLEAIKGAYTDEDVPPVTLKSNIPDMGADERADAVDIAAPAVAPAEAADLLGTPAA
jgi:hypothetical protein